MASEVHKEGDAGGQRVVVKFVDGPDSRTFAADEMIEVHMIAPGKTTPLRQPRERVSAASTCSTGRIA
jgi:hypothetical protein